MAFVNWLKRNLVVIAGLLTLGYLLLPNVVVMVFSFNKPKGRFNYQWQEFSTDAWKDPCGSPSRWSATASVPAAW